MSSDENDIHSRSEPSSSSEFSSLEDDELWELFDTDKEEDEFPGFEFWGLHLVRQSTCLIPV